MPVRIAINGFGRIGRLVLRSGYKNKDVQFVAVNDLADAKTIAHLLKYDSVHGTLPAQVTCDANSITVDSSPVKVFSKRDPETLPWRDLGIDVVLESTGIFTDRDDAEKHLKAGAKKVVISAPAKRPDVTFVFGVNAQDYDRSKHQIISMGSCTTNCLAPLVKPLNDKIGLVNGLMTTIHAYTNDQVLTDVMHEDLRRARSATMSMIPTKTGAAAAVGLVLPELQGKLDGVAIRVPTPNVSVVDLKIVAQRKTDVKEINEAMKRASEQQLKGILGYTTQPNVSIDFNHDPHSSTFHQDQTKVQNGTLVRVMAWYDNEWGFSNRMSDTAVAMAKLI